MIRVRNLVKTFGTFTAVDDVTFDVAEGEIFAFLGPNGAGKTTTIKMLTTLLKPTSGEIELDGADHSVVRPGVPSSPKTACIRRINDYHLPGMSDDSRMYGPWTTPPVNFTMTAKTPLSLLTV